MSRLANLGALLAAGAALLLAQTPAAAVNPAVKRIIDRDGNQSLVSAYLEPVRQELTAPPASPKE